jgi:hypothetical protein
VFPRTARNGSARRAIVIGVVLAVITAACSDGDDTGRASQSTDATTSTSATPRPEGPAAELTEEITGENAPFMGEAVAPDLDAVGYVEEEFVAEGTATSYRVDGERTADGRWAFVPDSTAPYRTRIVVRRPSESGDVSGTVLVEWLNVSGGVDGNPDYRYLEDELVRQGHVWVGVSTQLIGVEGGPIIVAVPGPAADLQGKGLRKLDPERYDSLEHPGDGYSFDIYTQVARALRRGGPALGDVAPERVIAVGESQSALALTTYYNGVQRLTEAFDGFLVHSRAAASLPLVGPGEYADLAGGIGLEQTTFRTDLDAPILDIQAEGDITSVLDSAAVRQPETDVFRLWEIVGSSHADAFIVGPVADSLDCGAAINDGPMHFVVKAGVRALDRWLSTGQAPPVAPRVELTGGDDPEIRRDADGIALGGIRTPPVDVPLDVLSGVPGPNEDFLCLLLGSTKPLPPQRLAELYSSREDYEQRYEVATDAAIEAGFVLAEDKAAMLAFADPSRIGA